MSAKPKTNNPSQGGVSPAGVVRRRPKISPKPKSVSSNRRSLNLNDAVALANLTGVSESVVEPEACHDLTKLTKLDDEILCDMLHKRYKADVIYTYLGDILVAVNPFRAIKGIYAPKTQRKYIRSTRQSQPPHIYAVADAAFHDMLDSKGRRPQCCIVSGESGAGKTESAKLVMEQLMKLCEETTGGGSDKVELRQKIIAVNPLLEAFGNAQTTKNDNSSRFGKYTQLQFDTAGDVLGSDISIYLLEKSRVTSPGGMSEEEQNFHIFYYLFAGDGACAKANRLGPPEDYDYLTNLDGIDEVNDKHIFSSVLAAMQLVGFSDAETNSIWAILASILHLGQIEFKGETLDTFATISSASTEVLQLAVGGLGLDEFVLRDALLGTVINAGGETVTRKYTLRMAQANRDAMAKAVYGKLFSWIVMNVNQLLETDPKLKAGACSIGILDIFGFENFEENSFEQLCINLANEQLQYFFNEHVFAFEQEEYKKEGLDLSEISYKDNKPILDMHLKTTAKSPSLFALLDEQSLLQQSTAETLCLNFKAHFVRHPAACYSVPRGNQPIFTIEHYAGEVTYQAEHFIEKNKDDLAPDVVKALQDSSCPVTAELFLLEVDSKTGAVTSITNRKEDAATRKRKMLEAKLANGVNKRPVTVGTQFRVSLNLLYNSMSNCTPHFVRCIKPNEENVPYTFQDPFVMKQLKYTGMLATTRIRREGFAVRVPFFEFIQRFRVLGFSAADVAPISAESCEVILKAANIQGYAVGKTKIFLKHYHMDELEGNIWAMAVAARMIQRAYRRHITLRRTNRLLRVIEDGIKPLAERSARQRAEDVERRDDLIRQIEDERNKAADRRRRERAQAAEAARKKIELHRAQLKTQLELSNKELKALLTTMKTKTDAGEDDREEIAALYGRIVDKHEGIAGQIRESQDSVSKLRVEFQSALKQENDAIDGRDRLVQQIAYKAERGGPNAPRAIAALRTQLDALTDDCEVFSAAGREGNAALSNELAVTDELTAHHADNGRLINSTLRECGLVVRDRLDAANGENGQLNARIAKLLADKDIEIAVLGQERSALEVNIQELQARFADEQSTSGSVILENQRNVDQLKGVITATEAEIQTLSAQLSAEQQEAQLAKAQLVESVRLAESKLADAEAASTRSGSTSAAALSDLRAQLAQARQDIVELNAKHEDRVREMETEMGNLRKRDELKINGMQSQIADLQAQLEETTGALSRTARSGTMAVADKEDSILALEAKNAKLASDKMKSRASEAQLRSELEQTQLLLSEAESESQRLADALAARERLLNSQTMESTAVSDELRKLLEEKTALADLRHAEHDATVKKLEALIAKQRAQIQSLQEALDAAQQQHSRDLRQKDREMQTALAERDARIHELEVSLAQARASEGTKAGGATQEELNAHRAEMALLQARLDKIAELYDLLKMDAAKAQDEARRLLEQAEGRSADRERADAEQRSKLDRDVKELQAKLANANDAINRARQDAQRGLRSQQKELEDQIAALERTIRQRDQERLNMEQQLLRAHGGVKKMADHVEDGEQALKDVTAERNRMADELDQIRIREARERERHMQMHSQTVKSLESRLALQTEAQMRNFEKMKKAIVAMASKRPGNSTPGEGAHVDLLNYMTIINGEGGLPHNVRINRFTCKSYLVKLAASVEQRRWIVLDLQLKTLSWFVDNRELRISRKGQFALADIDKVVDPGTKNTPQPRAFMIGIPKRTYTFIAESLEMKECWLQIFRCILGQHPG